MRALRSSVALRLFGLSVFAFGLLSALGGSDPWIM
jgi:hypothetical protein